MTGSDQLAAQLVRLCRDRTGDPLSRVSEVGALPGHAGFSFAFTLVSGGRCERLVLRLPPPGVKHEGTADVVRQARLMETLGAHGIPVPPVRWYGNEPDWFGRPYSVVALRPGRTFSFEHPRESPLGPESVAELAEQAIAVLATLHVLDSRRVAPWLGPPLPPAEDVERWDRFRERSADPQLVALGPELRRRLLERAPREVRVGIFHGDFQWSNLLIDGGGLAAVLDWELAGVGAVRNDLGWLQVFSDTESWAEDGPAMPPGLDPAELEVLYREATGDREGDAGWFRALAGYKFAVISGFNLMLHRRGKRHDPFWEQLATSIPILMERALEILEAPR
ncbi:MAG TPA: phosphotransferase family protein [Solirubrobacteraceae bacterium]|nr:phosphotransferase family protein [Solirubrobacteraceae bacterium]